MDTILRCVFLIISVLVGGNHGQPHPGIPCPTEGFGHQSGEDRIPGIQGVGVGTMLVQSGVGQINCFGVITEWRFWKTTDCDDVIFQVWRPVFNTKGPDFVLVGENEYDAGHCNQYPDNFEVVWRVPENLQIPVEPMDVLGFTQVTGGNMISYNFALAPGAEEIHISDTTVINCRFGGVNPGESCNFQSSLAIGGFLLSLSLAATTERCKPPTLDNLPETVWVEENENVNTYVLDIEASQKNNYYGNVMGNVVPIDYALDPTITDFNINNNGRVRNDIMLNYELKREYVLPVTISAHLHTVTKNLTVYVLDQNEPHTFDELPDAKTVSAHTRKKGEEIYRVNTTDEDTINPSKIYYRMTAWASTPLSANAPYPPFNIDGDTGAVYCTVDLDEFVFPGQPDPLVYDLEITATDGHYSITDTLEVTIEHTRQDPVWLNIGNNIDIDEDTPGGSNIYKLAARTYGMEETRSNNPITYAIDPSTALVARETFTINETTGVITLMDNPGLDRVIQPSYTLRVTATDGLLTTGPNNLVININLINEHPIYNPFLYEVTIPEECGNPVDCCIPGLATCVLPLLVPGLAMALSDREVTASLPVLHGLTCTLQNAYGSDLFLSPLASCDQLHVNARIDVDAMPSYGFTHPLNLTVRAADGYAGFDLAHIVVHVTDINDNAPIINPTAFSDAIYENTPGGLSLTTFTYTDADSGINANATFSIVNRADGLGTLYFQINETTGVLTTKQPVDYETYRNIQFDVIATDKGTPALRSPLAPVSIDILDINDHHPQWDCTDRPSYDPYDWDDTCFWNLELRSDILVGFKFIQLKAYDIDLYNHTYLLLIPNFYFLVHTYDGWVVVKEPLKAYTKNILYPYVLDAGDPELLSIIMWVRIDVFPPADHLVDIVLEIPGTAFNTSQVQTDFLQKLRYLINVDHGLPWWVKIERIKLDRDKVTVTIYALNDTTTYHLGNLHMTKFFVHRDDLLDVLRKNFFGGTATGLESAAFDPYKPYTVEPTHPNWWLDTVAGLCVLTLLCLLGLGAIIAGITGVLYWRRKLCFKNRPLTKNFSNINKKNVGEAAKRHEPVKKVEDAPIKDSSTNSARRSPETLRERRPSIETIHSLTYDPITGKQVGK